jgi:hypothetical protein
MSKQFPSHWIKTEAHRADMDQLRSYVRRGRQHHAESDEQLDALWIDGVRSWAAVIHPRTLVLDDAEAEMSLRDREPPQDQVGPELAAVIEGAGRELEAMPVETVRRVLAGAMAGG